ncbi:zf-HC2 domain-containing protein [Candidatus Fermentibacteria bacterium]|nr:zf-HC2 domain-containing protein [Candidatus Fermentibacteria bacterium]
MHGDCEPLNLNDFVDGALPREKRREIARHLRVCAECRAEVGWLRSLRAEVRSMPTALPPRHDLWQGIRARTAAAPRRRAASIRLERRVILHPAWAWAFSVGVCVLFTLIAPWSQAPMMASRLVGCDGGSLAGYEPASVLGNRPAVEVKAVMSRHIDMVDDAIGQLFAALREDPTDLRLVRMLRQEFQRKVSLVRNTARLMDEMDAAVPTTS